MDGNTGWPSRDGDLRGPLSDAEIMELADALHALAANGSPVPRTLMRHAPGYRHYGYTLDAVPAALDLLGDRRERVVVGLLQRFLNVIRENHEYIATRPRGSFYDSGLSSRYFDVVFFLPHAKPQTKESIEEVAEFLRSEKSEVHEKAATMLRDTDYVPVAIDRLIENVEVHGIQQWPNRQSMALASFAHIPEVRARLMRCLHSPKENLRSLAIATYSNLKETVGPEAESDIFRIAEDDADNLQHLALHALRSIVPDSPRLKTVALRLMTSNKYWVRGNAIASLKSFEESEILDAMLAALLDEGGHDFDNAGEAAKWLLQRAPLPPRVLPILMSTLETLMSREDKLYGEHAQLRREAQAFADACKEAARLRGESTEGFGTVSYESPPSLLAVARILRGLGTQAAPAISLVQQCLSRPYVAGSSNEPEWREILDAIRETRSR